MIDYFASGDFQSGILAQSRKYYTMAFFLCWFYFAACMVQILRKNLHATIKNEYDVEKEEPYDFLICMRSTSRFTCIFNFNEASNILIL